MSEFTRAKVLVVEDEPDVRRLVSTQLASLGYEAATASTGPEALQVLSTDPDFDVLFTDVVMPGGMNGVELARRACEINPGLCVLFTSGYSQEALPALPTGSDRLLLRKPYRRRALQEAMEATIAARA